jgi:protein-disulfide isomerase
MFAWTVPNAPVAFLALDRNNNGQIDDGAELFGSTTRQPPPVPPAKVNGYAALAVYDDNGDGRITAADPVFSELLLWRDANHNGTSEAGELTLARDAGIVSVSLDYHESRRTDQFGNIFRYRARVEFNAEHREAGSWSYDVFLMGQWPCYLGVDPNGLCGKLFGWRWVAVTSLKQWRQVMNRTIDALTNGLLIVMCAVTTVVAALTIYRLVELPKQTVQGSSRSVENIESWQLALDVREGHAETSQAGRIAVIEFADFECPYCERFANHTLPELRRRYVDSGRVHYQFMNFPLVQQHPRAAQAAAAGVCATRQQKFKEMHGKLFERPGQPLATSDFSEHARQIGMNIAEFESCMSSIGPEYVSRDVAEGMRLGVRVTPTFFIGRIEQGDRIKVLRRISGAESFATFATALAELGVSEPRWLGFRLFGWRWAGRIGACLHAGPYLAVVVHVLPNHSSNAINAVVLFSGQRDVLLKGCKLDLGVLPERTAQADWLRRKASETPKDFSHEL